MQQFSIRWARTVRQQTCLIKTAFLWASALPVLIAWLLPSPSLLRPLLSASLVINGIGVTHQIRAIQQCQHGNVYADTSSVNSIVPGLIEWAVDEIGVERILFGTDTPLYHAAMQRARVVHAELSDADKRLILRENALRLFASKLDHLP